MIDERFYRATTVVFFVTAMSISIFFRSRAARRSQEKLRGEVGGAALIVARLTFVLGLLSFLVAYAVKPNWTRWASMDLPDAVRIAGALLVLSTFPCFIWLFRHLGRNVTPTAGTRAEHSLVITGPYRWVRHPLYTVGIAFWLGLSIFTAKWIILMFAAGAIMFLAVRTPREEANLLERFGDDYRDYCARTGRYFPKIFA